MPPECLKIILSIDWEHPSFGKSMKSAIVFPRHTRAKNWLSVQKAARFS
jgi:hypothetical protein